MAFVPLLASDLVNDIRAAQSSGDFGRAATLYRQLIASGEDTPEIRSNLATMLHLSGQDAQALAEAQNALKRNPNLAGPNLIAGVSLFRLGRPKEAVPYLERAHRQDPRGMAPLLALGQTYTALRDYARSNGAYRDASQIDPANAEAWYGLGITFRSLAHAAAKNGSNAGTAQTKQLIQSALSALNRAVALDPQSPRVHLILADIYRDSLDFPAAIREYQSVLTNSPDDVATALGLATTYWRCGKPDEAIPQLEKVLKKLPEDPEANGIMAQILVDKASYQAATPFAVRALKGNPELLQVRFALARIYLSEDRPDLAVPELKRAAPSDSDGSLHFLLYQALKKLGQKDEAAAALAEFKKRREASEGGVRN